MKWNDFVSFLNTVSLSAITITLHVDVASVETIILFYRQQLILVGNMCVSVAGVWAGETKDTSWWAGTNTTSVALLLHPATPWSEQVRKTNTPSFSLLQPRELLFKQFKPLGVNVCVCSLSINWLLFMFIGFSGSRTFLSEEENSDT